MWSESRNCLWEIVKVSMIIRTSKLLLVMCVFEKIHPKPEVSWQMVIPDKSLGQCFGPKGMFLQEAREAWNARQLRHLHLREAEVLVAEQIKQPYPVGAVGACVLW